MKELVRESFSKSVSEAVLVSELFSKWLSELDWAKGWAAVLIRLVYREADVLALEIEIVVLSVHCM